MRTPGLILPKGDALIARWGAALSRFSSVVTIVLAFVIFADVIARYVFNAPIHGVVESGSLLLGYIVFLPQAYTLAVRGHIQVSIATDRMSPRGRLLSDTFVCVVGLFFISLLTYFSWFYFWNSFVIRERMGSAMVAVPYWVSKFAMPAGFFFFALMFLSRLLLNVAQLLGKKEQLEERMRPVISEE